MRSTEKIQFEMLYGRFPLVRTLKVDGETFHIVLNRLPITPTFIDPVQRDSGIVVLSEYEIPVPACPTDILERCGETMRYRDTYSHNGRYGLTEDLEDARTNLRKKNKRDALRQVVMYTPPPRKGFTVDVCDGDDQCWEMAHILGTGQAGVVSLLCDLGVDDKDRLQDVSDCDKILKTQYLGRRFYWEVYALTSLPEHVRPKLLDVWQCMAFNQGFIVEEKTQPLPHDHEYSPQERAEVVRLLEEMRRHGWVHQDLHRGNIHRRTDGSFVFIDFGYSRRFPISPPDDPRKSFVCVTGEHVSTLGPLTFDTAVLIEQNQLLKTFRMGGPNENEYQRALGDRRKSYRDRVSRIWSQQIVEDIIELRSKLWEVLSGKYKLDQLRFSANVDQWTASYDPDPWKETLEKKFRMLSNGEI